VLGNHLVVAWERQHGQGVKVEHADLEHLLSRARPAALGEPCLVGDPDHAGSGILGDVIHADKADQLDLRTNLFHAFASCGVPWVLVVIDESPGQAPEAEARLNCAATQQHAAIDLDHDCGRDLRVMPQNEVVIWTGLDLAPFDDSHSELAATKNAVVSHLSTVALNKVSG
jgi:hypothetical protein